MEKLFDGKCQTQIALWDALPTAMGTIILHQVLNKALVTIHGWPWMIFGNFNLVASFAKALPAEIM